MQPKRCSNCHCVTYCSMQCQRQHRSEHKVLCGAIHQLAETTVADTGNRYDHLSKKKRTKLVGLVGNQCLVECYLEGKKVTCLWDTGAQVSLLSTQWLQENFPTVKIKDVKELIDVYPGLDLTAVNGSRVPFNGWTSLNLTFGEDVHLEVPFLVMEGHMDQALIGYNVIETVVKEFPESSIRYKLFPTLKNTQVDALVETIQNTAQDDIGVSVPRQSVIIPAGQCKLIRCAAKIGQCDQARPLLFEPEEE